MYRIPCLTVLVGVVTCNAPASAPVVKAAAAVFVKAAGKSASVSANAGNFLQKDVLYVSGSIPTPCAPVEYYYVSKDHSLLRKDQGVNPINVAKDVALVFTGWDDSVWYSDVNGKVFRLDYNSSTPVKVPGPAGSNVQLTHLAPVHWGESWAVSKDGDVYHFIANAWFKLDKSDRKTGISIGNDGVLLSYDRNSSKIWSFNYGIQHWDVYEQQGVSADLADTDHVVIVKDLTNVVAKKVDGKWQDVPDVKCRRVSAFDESSFYCTTPEGGAKVVAY